MGAAACMVLTNAEMNAEEDAAAQVEEVQEEKAPKKKKEKKAKVPKVKKEKAPKVKKEKAPKPVAEEMKIEGVIVKEEKQKKEGGKVSVKYVLTSSDGIKITLPKLKKPKAKKGEKAAPAKTLADYVGAGVTVIGKGVKKKKGGKDAIILQEIIDIKKAGGVAEIDIFKKDTDY